jgi:hypothetical protein
VISDLNLERSLDQPLRRLAHQPARPNDLLLAAYAGEQLVDELARKLTADFIRHPIKDPRRGRRLA